MLNTSFAPWPSFTEEEITAVSAVLRSNKVNYWTGQHGQAFEQAFAKFTDCRHAVAVANGTLALDLALKTLNISPGDEIIVTSRTFIASVSCIINAGAIPVFADIDYDSQNISAETISKVLTDKTRAIICVHLAGWPCEMDEIMALATEHKLYVIEDCAQAHGAKYKGRSVGSFGHIGAWSFCQDKIMTTGGEGGMVTTNDEVVWKTMWAYKDHGKSWDAIYKTEHPPGYRWLHESFGTNWRMSEIQAVIGRLQLKRMANWTSQRQKNGTAIDDIASKFKVTRVVRVPDHLEHAEYKHYIFVRPEYLVVGWSRDRIIEEINSRGVPCFQGTCSEVYLEKAFDGSGFKPKTRLPIAKELGETSLMFLVHPTLTDIDVLKTRQVIGEVLELAQK
mgnify:CR=1 FL=1